MQKATTKEREMKATKMNGEAFAANEMATVNTIDHSMMDTEFMVYCDTNPLPIVCECGCSEVADHNTKVRQHFGYGI